MAAMSEQPGTDLVPARPDDEPGQDLAPADSELQPAGPERTVIYADITGMAGERKPIIPVELQLANLRATVEMWAGLNWHRSRYHGLRLPLYVMAVVFWSLIGAGRLVLRVVHWAMLLEQHSLRSETIAVGDSREWRALHKELKQTRKNRLIILGVEAGVAAVALLVAAQYLVKVEWLGVAGVALLLFARFGRPLGHRIVSPAVVPPQYEEPTQDSISEALGALGIKNINDALKASPRLNFVTPVMQSGPGWNVQIDLPRGVTAGHIIARRPELASALRRPLSATWPGGVPAEHEARLELWVGFHDITKTKPPKYPLIKAGTTDIFGSTPLGTDPRQRPITAPLFEVNWLIGAAPGQGKTSVLRVLAASAVLDPVCDVWVHEHAGKGDLEPYSQVCHRYTSGLDDEAIAYAAESARLLRAELEHRSALFKRLPREAKPDGKLTRDLAMKYLRLRPVVAFFDEVQNVVLHPEYGAQFAEDIAYVIRLGRAYGIIVVLATQRPDKDSLPTAVTGLVSCRLCLKVPDQVTNDMILGTGAYKSGYDSSIFRAKTDAGLAWLKADGDPQIVRTYYLDLNDSQRICSRARAMRERLGVLTGFALGLDDDGAPARDVLADVAAVIGTGNGLHWGPLADALAARYPDRWADATGDAVSAQCRAQGVASVDVKVDGVTLKGARRVLVERELAKRLS
jgi:S-DNA-T family DNA segregation ATPase FtsK/SpoIIIE